MAVLVRCGRDIENYIPSDVFASAVEQVHPSLKGKLHSANRPYTDYFGYVGNGKGKLISQIDKVGIANHMASLPDIYFDRFDLGEGLSELITYIRLANDLPHDDRPV